MDTIKALKGGGSMGFLLPLLQQRRKPCNTQQILWRELCGHREGQAAEHPEGGEEQGRKAIL